MLTSKIAWGWRFLSHWLTAIDEHSLQAPFIFEFYTKVVKNPAVNQGFRQVEDLRRSLVKDSSVLRVTDFGTGADRTHQRSIRAITKSSNQPRVSRLLYHIADRYKPRAVLELGTSMGLSALSMAAAIPDTEIITMEGCPNISETARLNFKRLKSPKIKIVTGDIQVKLPEVLSELGRIDLLFMDADHRHESTLKYFSKCLPKFRENTVVVVDDIHWSTAMEAAWEIIKGYEQVRLTADLFFCGVVFFRKNFTKAHYVLSI